MPPEQPTVVVLGGVNGAGKSTSARALLAQQLAITTFVNSDEIARGLNAFAPHTVAFEAGRVMLNRLRELAEARSDIGFETTLAGRTYLPFLTELKGTGYAIEIHYFWLQSPELAVQRIRDRVQSGGHDIPAPIVLRRYERSLWNSWHDYRKLADAWFVYDNSTSRTALTAAGASTGPVEIGDVASWALFKGMVGDA